MRKEITRYSNLKNRAVAIDKLRREVELRGSQTYTQAKDIGRLIWKKIELQGSQTSTFQPQAGLEGGIELQDSQQSSMANSIGFGRE